MAEPDFPALVRAFRQRLGLTQEQLAQELGVSFSTVNVWENGKREPLPFLGKCLLEMAKAAGVPEASKKAPPRRRTKR